MRKVSQFFPGLGFYGYSLSLSVYVVFSPCNSIFLHLEGVLSVLSPYSITTNQVFLLPHLFSYAERNVFVFDHVHDLALHCQDK